MNAVFNPTTGAVQFPRWSTSGLYDTPLAVVFKNDIQNGTTLELAVDYELYAETQRQSFYRTEHVTLRLVSTTATLPVLAVDSTPFGVGLRDKPLASWAVAPTASTTTTTAAAPTATPITGNSYLQVIAPNGIDVLGYVNDVGEANGDS